MDAIVTGQDLARAVYNALLWAPKEHPWDMGYVCLSPQGVSLLTSDSYATTRSTARADSVNLGTTDVVLKISRGDLLMLEAKARQDVKEMVHLEFVPYEALIYHGSDEEPFIMADLYAPGEGEEESWDDINIWVFADLLQERMDQPHAHKFMLDPAKLRKFSMTKRADPNLCADFWVRGSDPVFVQIGPDSQTIIMPVSRERHAEANGKEVLW